MNNQLSVLSVTAGIGGMTKGAKIAGFKTVYQSDIWDKVKLVSDANIIRPDLLPGDYCISEGVYQAGEEEGSKINFGNMYNTRLGTINAYLVKHGYSPVNLGELALLTSGSPCQDMSRVNPLRNPAGVRNQLMIQQLRLLLELRPMVAVFEQVDGFLDNVMTPFRQEFLRAMETVKKHYRCDDQTMNAKFYGARQDRKRIIFIMVRKDLDIAPSFPTASDVCKSQFVSSLMPYIKGYTNGKGWHTADEVFGTMTSGAIKVLTTDDVIRPMTINERKILCNLENLNMEVAGVTNQDIAKMLGNMVQIPFMAAIAQHIRTAILKM